MDWINIICLAATASAVVGIAVNMIVGKIHDDELELLIEADEHRDRVVKNLRLSELKTKTKTIHEQMRSIGDLIHKQELLGAEVVDTSTGREGIVTNISYDSHGFIWVSICAEAYVDHADVSGCWVELNDIKLVKVALSQSPMFSF
jgi:hypothetical protein